MSTTDQRDPSSDVLDLLSASISRHRHALGPLAMALGMLAFAWVSHLWFPTLGTIAAAVVFILGMQGASQLPTARRERLWGYLFWFSAMTWTVLAVWAENGPLTRGIITQRPVLLYLLAGLTIAFGIPWYWHRRVRRGIQVDKSIAAWGDGGKVGLKGATLRGTDATLTGFSGVIEGIRGVHHYSQFEQARSRIASLFGVHASAVVIERGTHEAEARVRVQEMEPDAPEVWEPPMEPVSIKDLFSIGLFDDGSPILYRFFGPDGGLDGVMIGVKGSGKSNLMNVLIAYVAACYDAVPWIADLKPGAQEHKEWKPLVDAFAETPEQVDQMYTALWSIFEERGSYSGRKFEPTRERPAIVIFVDESSVYFAASVEADLKKRQEETQRLDRRKALVAKVMAVCRSLGGANQYATQFGLFEALGNTTIRNHLVAGHAIAFRTAKAKDAGLVFPVPGGIDTGRIPRDRPGTMFMDGPEQDRPILGRVHGFGDRARSAFIAFWTGRQPVLEPAAVTAGAASYEAVHRYQVRTVRTQDTPPAAETPQEPQTKTRQRLTPEQSRKLVYDALAGFVDGATVADLTDYTGRSATIIQSRLNELEAMGMATHKGRRKPVWRAVADSTTGTDR